LTEGRIRKRLLQTARPMLASRASALQPMKSSRGFSWQLAAANAAPPRTPCREERIQ